MASILVTGGNGFVASHVVDALAPHHIVILDKRPRPSGAMPVPHAHVTGTFADGELVRHVLREHAVELVCHAGWAMNPMPTDALADMRLNVEPTIQLLEACAHAGVQRVLLFSSASVYGNPSRELARELARETVDELQPTNPVSAYGIAKLMCEKHAQLMTHMHGVQHVIARISSVFGPRQDPTRRLGVINIFTHRIMRGLPIPLRGDGSALRDYVYATDAARVLAMMMTDARAANHTFNVGGVEGTTLSELVEIIGAELGATPNIVREPLGNFEIPRLVLDTTAARAMFAWQRRVSLREGIRLTAEWLRTLD